MGKHEWKTYKFSELMEIIGGGTPKTSIDEYWNGNIPWLSVKDFNSGQRKVYDTEKKITKTGLKNSSTKVLNKGDVIISARGTVGALAQLGRPMAFNQSCYGLRANEKTTNDFIYYLLKYKLKNIKQNTHGSVFDTITKSTFDILSVTIPQEIEEQKAIADILSSLDDKIEVNNQINKTLEEIAQAIFKHWFIDFEFPNERGKPYKSSGGKMVESELGLIPKGWEVKELGDLGEFKNGINYNRNVKGKSEYYIVNVRDIVENTFIRREKLEKINIDSKKAEKYLLKEKDILIIRSASPGEIGILAQPQDNIIYSGFTIRYSLIDKQLFYYLYFVLKNVKKNLEQLSNGTTLRNINQKILKSYKVILPNKRILQNSNKIFICILDKINQINNENQVLSQIRDTLLPKLMSGEIRVV